MKAVRPPSYLLIDLGNTRIKWGTADAKTVPRPAGEYPTAQINSAWISALARKYGREHAVLASVVPRWMPAFQRAFSGRMDVVTGSMSVPGMAFDYPKPAEVGADRIAAAVAAQIIGSVPAIVVACGTATAFTVLDAQGRLCGGAIAPGLQAQLDALSAAAAQLPSTQLRPLRVAIGKSTGDAIRLGVLCSFRGGVRETVLRLSSAFTQPPTIYVTGGAARHLGSDPGFPFTLRPLLVLEGLHIIAQRRHAASSA